MAAIFSSCNYVDYDPGIVPVRAAAEGELTLKAGIMVNNWQYVQKDVQTIITLVARDGYAVTNIDWAIEDSVYTGLTITHVFKTLRDVTIHATATLGDGSKLTADFTVTTVKDMSPYEPIRVLVIGGDYLPFNEGFQFEGQTRWKVLMLFSKERVKNTTFGYGYWGSFDDYNPSFDMETWGPVIQITTDAENYVIKDGLPSQATGEVGKYFAVHLQLLPREYRMYAGTFQDKDKMLFAYGDFAGSEFIKTSSANLWLIRFRLNVDGTITPLGD
jgi:hypothetical protein